MHSTLRCRATRGLTCLTRAGVSLPLSFFFTVPTLAQTTLWSGHTGEWTDSHWSAGVPGSSSDASIVSDSTVTLSTSASINSLHLTSSSLTVAAAGELTTTGAITLAQDGALYIGNGGAAGAVQAGGVTFDYPSGTSYPVVAFNHTGTTTFTPVISGRGQVTKSGAGTTILAADNTYTSGGTVVNAGTLQLGSGSTTGTVAGDVSVATGATLAFNRSNDQTFAGVISGDGSVVQRGVNTLTLSGANTFTGGTVVQSGTLRGTSGGNFGSGAITLAGGSLTLANNANTNFARNLIVSANATVTADRTSGSSTGRTHALGTLSIGAQTLNIARGSSISGSGVGGIIFGATTLTGNATFALATNTALTLGAIGDGGNGYGFTKTGSTTLTLASDNTYTGTTTISSGTLQVGSGGSTGSIAGNIVNNGTLTINRTGTLALAGAISGTGGLTKTGSGTLTLSGNNSYAGSTVISGGTVVVTADHALGTSAGGTSVGSASFLELQGGVNYTTPEALSLSTGNSGGLRSSSGENTWAGNVGVNGLSRVLVSTGSQLSLTGVVSGSSTLALNGGGKLVLGNSGNSFFGALTIGGGSTLVATADGALGHTAGQINVNSGTLAFSGGITYSSAKPVTLIGNGATDRNGALDNLSGNNRFAGNIVLSDAVARIGAATGTTLTLTGTISAQISGWGPTYAGPGTIVVTGNNSYTGATTLAGGTLEFSALDNLGSGSSVVFDGGALRFASGNTADLSARTVTIQSGGATVDTGTNHITFANAIGGNGAGALTKTGSGTLTLSGTNTYTGTTQVNAGALVVDGSLASSLTLVNAHATLAGSGSVGALTIANGGVLAPGNSPGTLSAGNTTFESGGVFAFEIADAAGTAGTAWDLLSISGTLFLSATAEAPFVLDLISLDGLVSGAAANFNPAADYSFTFLTTTDGISDFSADAFSIHTSSFANPFSGQWSVSRTNSGNDLSLVYSGGSAIPEPATYAAITGICMLAAAACRRRASRRRRAGTAPTVGQF